MGTMVITSVGTGIGKTLVTAILCHQLEKGTRVFYGYDGDHVGGNGDWQDAGHGNIVQSIEPFWPIGAWHQAGGFRFLG